MTKPRKDRAPKREPFRVVVVPTEEDRSDVALAVLVDWLTRPLPERPK